MAKKLFAGGNSPLGFYSYYYDILDKRRDGRLYILKGGSGVGKGTFIRRFAEALENIGEEITYYYCSGDSESLDGAYAERLNIAMIDGTAPHVVDPILPSIRDEIVNLGVFLNHDKLIKHKVEIQKGINHKAECFKVAYEILSSVEKLDNIEKYYYEKAQRDDVADLVAGHLADKYIDRAENIPPEYRTDIGRVRHSFMQAITPEGIVRYGAYEYQNYHLTELVAESDTEMHAVLTRLAKLLIDLGIDVEAHHNPLRPLEILSLSVPDYRDYYCRKKILDSELPIMLLAKSNEYGDKNYALGTKPFKEKKETKQVKRCNGEYALVDIRAVTDDSVREGRDIIRETENHKEKLILLAVGKMAEAKESHKGLEKHYIDAMDWNALEKFRAEFIEKIIKEI